MADKRMNQFTPATDMEYVYAELADGSQVKIKKSDLAKNIGEIMQELRLFPYNTYKWGNEYSTESMYRHLHENQVKDIALQRVYWVLLYSSLYFTLNLIPSPL